jgi:thiol-disulfide isomerase/thioredoxin
MKEKLKQYFARKSKFGLAADLLVISVLLLSLIPQTRMEMATFVIRARMLIVQPSINETHNTTMLVDSDYQISFKDLNGKKFDFSSLTGKVIFINFWATWCPPCVAEMPAIQELYNMYKDNSNVAFLLVSNETPEEVKKFIHKKGYTFPVYLNENKLPQALSSASIPATFVISKTGKLVISETGAANWVGERMLKTMDELIKE